MTVVEEEMPAIRAAFRKFDAPQQKYLPKLSIVVCGKRHHTRFYPTDAAGADINGNPKPGTVVDRGVTAVYNFDFFLQGKRLIRFPGVLADSFCHSSCWPPRDNEANTLLCRSR